MRPSGAKMQPRFIVSRAQLTLPANDCDTDAAQPWQAKRMALAPETAGTRPWWWLGQDSRTPQVIISQKFDHSSFVLFSVIGSAATKRLLVVMIAVLLTMIGASQAAANSTPEAKAAAAERMMRDSNCFSCHMIDHKFIGPAFAAVARRYAKERRSVIVPKLVEKVRAGGSGDWGHIPMVAHPKLNKAKITQMVEWVLSLKSAAAIKSAEAQK